MSEVLFCFVKDVSRILPVIFSILLLNKEETLINVAGFFFNKIYGYNL